MKKLFLTIVMLAAAVTGISAQIFNNPDNKPYWGMRISLDVDMPGNWETNNNILKSMDMYSAGAGVSIGAVYNLPVIANFYFEPGASLYYDTFKDKGLLTSTVNQIMVYPKYGRFGIRIPLMLGYHFDLFTNGNIAIFTGPELSYAFVGHISYDNDDLEDAGFGLNMFKDEQLFKRFDVAWRVGAAVNAGSWHIGISYAPGITSITKNNITCHDNRLAITLGHNF